MKILSRRIILINTKLFPCPGSHLLHTRKFLNSFSSHDFTCIEVDENELKKGFTFLPGDLVYLSNHGLEEEVLTQEQFDFMSIVSRIGVIPICWFWQDQAHILDELFNTRWLLTGEHLRAQFVLPSHEKFVKIARSRDNFIPITFAAGIAPSRIGKIERQNKFNASFVGHRYQKQLNRHLRLTIPKTKIVYTPPFIDELDRLDIFTSSHVVLGWHSKENVRNGNVVERVFEGIAYGSVVVTDNPYGLEATDGNVLFADNFEDAKMQIQRVIRDDRLREKIQSKGLFWAKEFGTYDAVARSFILKAENL